jgi:thiamine-monophosphate kinase
MPSEKEIIEIMDRLLPQKRLNRCNESDCEIIILGGKRFLYTTDEFSAEDRFCERDPRLLGWNIAAGAISDIYACGGAPLYYAHSLTVAKTWDTAFVEGFGRGVADALRKSGALCIGGDCGQAQAWRCCVSVIGACKGAPMTRVGARPGHGIYLSGRIGAGNVQAALGVIPAGKLSALNVSRMQLPLRGRETALIRRYASSCIDTSDGVWKAVSILADINECGYALNALPYHRAGALIAKAASLPQIMLFLSECGEYELLFTVPADRERKFTKEAHKNGMRFYRLGIITESSRIAADGKDTIDLSSLKIEARGFDSTRHYLRALTRWILLQKSPIPALCEDDSPEPSDAG